MIRLKNILVATDFGEASDAALAYGRELARSYTATLHVLHVADNVMTRFAGEGSMAFLPDLQVEIEKSAQERLNQLLDDEDRQMLHARPVVVTSLPDDDWGGDTNKDGPSVGSTHQWRGIRFHGSSDASVLDHVLVRHGGNFGWPAVILVDADVALRDATIERCGETALSLQNNSRPTVLRCTFRDNGHYAVDGATIDAVPGFLHNEASGNGLGDYIRCWGFGSGTAATAGTGYSVSTWSQPAPSPRARSASAK